MPEVPLQLLALPHLSRTNLADRLLNMTFGGKAYPEPTQFQLTTAARLLDKALMEWDSALREFQAHSSARDGIPKALVAPAPGVTRAFFRAIGHLETLVDSLARLIRLIDRIESSQHLASDAELPLPTRGDRERVRLFRNRIAHGDEDIEQGKAGQGLATATLRPGPHGIELQGQSLDYAEIARMLEQTHDYVQAASK